MLFLKKQSDKSEFNYRLKGENEMPTERQENLSKYEKEKIEPEISLENAQLCANISKYWATGDNEVVFWKRKEIEILEKYYGKDQKELGRPYDELARECLECQKWKQSLETCKKALKVKEMYQFSFSDFLKTYAIMMNCYNAMNDYEKGLELGRRILNDDRVKNGTASETLNEIISEMLCICYWVNLKEEMCDWVNFGLNLAIKTCGEDSVVAAEMYEEKASFIEESKEEQRILLKKALLIFVSKCDIGDDRIRSTFGQLRRSWEDEADDHAKAALNWLKENMTEEDFHKVERWYNIIILRKRS